MYINVASFRFSLLVYIYAGNLYLLGLPLIKQLALINT
ncbi:hypothetical protein M23134_04193 [Microscilla marina ATCC 23134]|uniref:Uncharacterized protein n=1 Tax=Microscilla marina ATCC 23134 TaxID=313606 RepID=A1ZE52_MICM2|nr:hypothetical protein M23134_04193 [Microscilla marina ATCC 23134]